jgi:hypothetical protein
VPFPSTQFWCGVLLSAALFLCAPQSKAQEPSGGVVDGVTMVPGKSAALADQETIQQIKNILLKLEDADPKTTVSPSEWIAAKAAMQTLLISPSNKSADDDTLEAASTLLEKMKAGSQEEKTAFLAKSSALRTALADMSAEQDPVAYYKEFNARLFSWGAKPQLAGADDFQLEVKQNFQSVMGLMRKNPAASAPDIAARFKILLEAGGADLTAALKAGELKPFTDLNTEIQKIIGSNDLKLHIVAAAYGERAELDHFVSGGRTHRAGRADRWCNATAAMRTKCERKARCESLGAMSTFMCGYDPAEFVSPRYKGVLVQYRCIRDSNADFWLRPAANASSADPVRFTPDGGTNYAVFLTAPDQQLACEVQ